MLGRAFGLLLLATPAWADDYRVGPGDVLKVQVHDQPTLSSELKVGASCGITLALIGRVEVCDLTTTEIERQVTERLAGDYLVHPLVAVRVAEHRSQRVDVLGEVAKTGPIYLDGETTLVEVISAAGGPKADNVVRVKVVSADGTESRYDLRALASRAETVRVRGGDKVFLEPGEVVYVEGQIVKPGAVVLSDRLTVTQALALAGGPDEFANLRRVLVRRADGSQQRVNIPRVHRGREADPVLRPGDQLVVPRGAF